MRISLKEEVGECRKQDNGIVYGPLTMGNRTNAWEETVRWSSTSNCFFNKNIFLINVVNEFSLYTKCSSMRSSKHLIQTVNSQDQVVGFFSHSHQMFFLALLSVSVSCSYRLGQPCAKGPKQHLPLPGKVIPSKELLGQKKI